MTLFYPDVSNNNWGNMNYTPQAEQNLRAFLARLVPEGFAGVSHKMSQGTGYVDPYGAICQKWCAENNFPFIGYHYVDTSDPGGQAQNWLDAGGGANVMMDFEASSGDMDNFWAVTNAFNAVGVNVQLAYIPNWYLNSGAGGGGSLSDLANSGILLVSSAYPLGYQADYASTLYDQCGGDTGQGWAPYNGATPSAWQFTSAANIGGVSGVDCNAYRGADINVLFGTAGAPAPPTPVTPDPSWVMPSDPAVLLLVAQALVDAFLGVPRA